MVDIKTDRQGIYRTHEGLLVNKDMDGLKAYRAKKHNAKKIYEIEADVAEIKTDLAEIKEMLSRFVSK